MGRSKADAFQAFDLVDGFEQLNEGGFALIWREFALGVAGDDLAQQSNFFDPTSNQFAAFSDNISNGPAALLAAGVRDNAEGAVLIAALHDADERGDGFVSVAV